VKRILVTIHTPTFGGPHNQVLRMYKPLQELGWHTVVVLPEEPGNGYDRLAQAGIPCYRIPLHRLRATLNPRQHLAHLANFQNEVKEIRQIIRDEKIDVVQVCGLLSVQGALAARAEQRPIVWQLLSTFAPYPLRLLVTPLVRQMATVIMTTGQTIAKQHPGLLSAKERLIPFIPPVDIQLFQQAPAKRASARAQLGVPDDVILIGTVGNFSRQKGHEYLVEAAAAVRTAYPQTAVRILGAQTVANAAYYQKAVRQRAEALHLTQDTYLMFADPGNAVADLLPAFDIFVLTSRAEGIPTVVIEAMACGIPVIASNVGGVSEVIVDEVTGLLIHQLQVAPIVAAIKRLVVDPALRANLAKQALEVVRSRYTIQSCTNVHVQAYEQALQIIGKRSVGQQLYVEAPST